MRIVDDQDDRSYLIQVSLLDVVARMGILRPLVLKEGMPATHFVIFTDAALDDLSEHFYQLFFLLKHVVWARHERESRGYGLYLDGVLDLAGKLLAPLLHHVLLDDSCNFAQQVSLVENALVGYNICKEVFFL